MSDGSKVVNPETKISDYFPPSPKPKENGDRFKVKEDQAEVLKRVLLTPESTPTKCPNSHQATENEEPSKDSNVTVDASLKVEEDSSKTLFKKEERSTPEPSDPKVCKSENDTDCLTKSEKSQVKTKVAGKRKGKKGSTQEASSTSTTSQAKPKAARKKPEQRNSLLTDYFPIRRSSRVPSSELKKQNQRDLEEAILSKKKDGLKIELFGEKGRGVVATKPFKKGEFVVEYEGDLVTLDAAKSREEGYIGRTDVGCYMYYFNFQNKSYCVDATAETDKLGRLLNHSKTKPNCCTKVVGIYDKPYLILIAARDINKGEELMYDYGDRNKETLSANPWLAL